MADSGDLLVVPDLLEDEYFRDSPLAASGVRYYAGAPLTTADGHCLGAMCVLGMQPRQTTPDEISALCDLASMIMSQIELQHALGRIDPLSGLPNRNQFMEDFQDLQYDRPAGEQRLAVLINLSTPDQLGHAARAMSPSYLDELVTDAACWLRAMAGAGRIVYQVSSTQFALIAPPGATVATYVPLLEQKIAQAQCIAKSRYVATPMVGVAPFEVGASDCLSVLRQAQSAAQDAIDTPTHIAVYSEAEDARYRRRFALLNDFGAALESPGQLRLVFQPRIDLITGMCTGAEALLRWQHPTLGAVGPAEFIPVIERSGMAQATTAWVLASAMRQQRLWRDQGLILQLSVNVSAANLLEPDFAAALEAGLRQHGLEAACMELEITESAIMAQPVKAHAMLEAIAATGVRLAIDDFGTGYSSLSYLQRMPADVVKIDQSFIIGLEDDTRKQALVATMITLSQDLGLRVVAEGVEFDEVRTFLTLAGCDEAQGYLFARPMEAEELTGWCASSAPAITPGRSAPSHYAFQM